MSSQRSFEQIDALLAPPAAELVAAFYLPDVARKHSTKANFVGELFTTLGNAVSDSFEASDLVAVHLMGMTFRPSAVRALLEPGEGQDAISRLLRDIPNADIWSDDADFKVANVLWHRLAKDMKSTYPGINWVTAGKLLARKRPALLPVVDEVITTLVPDPPDDYWQLFRDYLQLSGRVERVEGLRPQGIGSAATPTLRLLDTAIWMRGSRGPARTIRLALGLSD